MDFTDLAHTPLEELYQASGQAIVVAIPEVWARAIVHVEIAEDDNGLVYGEYLPAAAGQDLRYFAPGAELYLVFDELRRRMRKPGCAPWHKADLTLQASGRFDIDFTYPDAAGV